MSGDHRVVPAAPEDAAAITEIYRLGVPELVLRTTALGSTRAAHYVASLIGSAGPGWQSRLWVARVGTEVKGFVQLLRDGSTVFVNNIYVHPSSRDAGIGTSLLRKALGDAGRYETVLLDVLDSNRPARAWYESLGFRPRESRNFSMGSLADDTDETTVEEAYVLCDLPQADAVHAAFGFSMVQVRTGAGSYGVGRMGEDWFRLAHFASLEDAALRRALRALGSNRHILVIDSSSAATRRGFQIAHVSTRMHIPHDALIARMER